MLTVSVIIPTYNRAHLIPRAIRSAVANLQSGDEIVVVDDASTDHTAEVVAGCPGPIRYLRIAHGGAGVARNHGVAAAQGDLVAFLDSDDEWLPDKLALQRTLLEQRPDVLFCFSDFRSKDEGGREQPRFLRCWHKDPRPWDDILAPGLWYSSLAPLPSGREDFRVHIGDMFPVEMRSHYIATSTTVIRRREAGEALRFAEHWTLSEDKACFARVASRGPGAYLDCETSIQWGHAGPRLTDHHDTEMVSGWLKLLEEIWEPNAAFMARYGEELRQVRRRLLLERVRGHLSRGETLAARYDLQRLEGSPLLYRLAAHLPQGLARPLMKLRRWLKTAAACS